MNDNIDHTKILALNLRFLRKRKGFTLEEASEKLGLKGFSLLQKYETGKAVPPVDMLQRLSSFYDVTSDKLLNDNLSLDEVLKRVGDEKARARRRVGDQYFNAVKKIAAAEYSDYAQIEAAEKPENIKAVTAKVVANVILDSELLTALVKYFDLPPEKQKSVLDFIKFQSTE